ncbi:hypothetical protein [Streptomyces sp. NBC_00158]|uniref:hypothetical protein n=1 Tax=Streptomyces sp. NBC_00158 TaxID=2903627 RepID=UPI002F91AB08
MGPAGGPRPVRGPLAGACGRGRVELYTHALCYKPGTGSPSRSASGEKWARWERVTGVEDDRTRLQRSDVNDYTLWIQVEGNVEPLTIDGFTGDQEFVSKVARIAVEAAKPKVYAALNDTGAFHLAPPPPRTSASS